MVDGVQFVDRGASGKSRRVICGGLGLIDFDNDGFMDVVVGDVPGAVPTRLFRNAPDGAGGERFLSTSVWGAGWTMPMRGSGSVGA